MRPLLFISIFFISLTSIAQNPIEVEIGNFDTIKVYDLVEVNLVKSNENKIIISGLDADDVEYVNKKGTLKIRMDFDKIFDGTQTFVHVYYTNLETIDGNEGARITSNEMIEQDHLEIRVQEGAQVKAGLDVNKLDLRAVTGGIIELSGTVDNQNLTVNTGGIVENRDLKTSYTNVKVRAGGEVEVFARQRVKVNIQAGGDVIVYGNPQSVSRKTILGGSIVIKD